MKPSLRATTLRATQLSRLLSSLALLALLPLPLTGQAAVPEKSATPPARLEKPVNKEDGMRPFDPEDYALAFDAFLGSGDRDSAFRVAQKAVASVPGDSEWRRKLARVAEWTQRPLIAWEHWNTLFDQGDRNPETLAAVQRLASFADRTDVALKVWKIRLQSLEAAKALSETQWQEILNLYQADSSERAREGSRFFERQYRQLGKISLLERAANLADDAGEDERALSLYRERVKQAPFSQIATLQAAIFLLRRDQANEAYELLLSQQKSAGKEAQAYWGLLINVALDQAKAETAESALRQLEGTPLAKSADWPRLISLLRRDHPVRAAELALEHWHRSGNEQFFLNAFETYIDRGNRQKQKQLLADLSDSARSQLEKTPQFLMLRARHYQGLQADDLAWADLQRVLKLQPDHAEASAAMIWALLDRHRMTELRALLQRLQARAASTPALWMPFAAARHALDDYREALHWYRKEITRLPDDHLLLLNYADALERAQQGGMAARIRRHAWQELRRKFPQPDLVAPLDAQPELLAQARLALLNTPGDTGLALVRKLVTTLRGLPAPRPPEATAATEDTQVPPPDAQTRDLVLAWAVSHELPAQSRAWLWLNALRRMAAGPEGKGLQYPLGALWGEAQTALQQNDTQTMNRLLLQHGDALPIYNRYDTAAALEHWPLALDIAFQGMTHSGVDEELHDRYRQHAPKHLNHIQMRLAKETAGAYDGRHNEIELHLVADRRLRLTLGMSRTRQSSTETTLATPDRQQLNRVQAQWLGTRGETTVEVFRHKEGAGNTGLRLAQTWVWDSRVSLSGEVQRRAEATDSLPLRVAGNQDSLQAAIHYALSRREYLSFNTQLKRYHTQYQDYLGSSRTFNVEAGYRIRLEYPDWRLRLYATRQNFSYNGAPGIQALAALPPSVQAAIAAGTLDGTRYFLPEGSTTAGLCLGMGENLAGQNLQETYTRAWRPFYDVCANHNNINGRGYTGLLGLAGSVTGEDHLSLRMEQTNGGTGAGNLSRILAARYRHYF